MDNTKQKAIVLLSGGLDSATALALAISKGFDIVALTFDYGQRHKCEISSAREIASKYNINHRILKLDLAQFGHSALTTNIAIPKGKFRADQIPVTYVPARNTIFLSYALALAEVESADFIYIGVNALDYSGYPDCRPEYIEKFQEMANLATKRAVDGKPVIIEAPLINMTKAEVIRAGMNLKVDYSKTISCYDPDSGGAACGECDSCHLRREGFKEAGVADPTRYVKIKATVGSQ
ncbi:MAG: 7-cyano-7-deazaguanine synthase QueC [candidate division Zixibacteria bacterium]|nr:7-cyano-7-deazaguanine synthase QueC [candidate division Zixibacteria bacterium]